MHISCERNLLKNAIDQVSKAISTKQALPILGHILFEASDSNLKLTASSLDIGISCTIPVSEMRDGGATTCSAKVIAEIIVGGLIEDLVEVGLHFAVGVDDGSVVSAAEVGSDLRVRGAGNQLFTEVHG